MEATQEDVESLRAIDDGTSTSTNAQVKFYDPRKLQFTLKLTYKCLCVLTHFALVKVPSDGGS